METVINLHRARKARARAAKAAEAAENRIRHGRSKDEKRRDELEAERVRRALDQASIKPSR